MDENVKVLDVQGGNDGIVKYATDGKRKRSLVKLAPLTPTKVFLVGAFPLREKCPTIAVTVFFLQTTILTLIGPLFLQFLQS